jgi:CapZ-interacting protein
MPPQSAGSTLTEKPADSPALETPTTDTSPEAASPAAEETTSETPAETTSDDVPFGSAADADLAAVFEKQDAATKPKSEAEPEAKPEAETEAETEAKPDPAPIEDDPRMPVQLRARVKEQNKQLFELQKQKQEYEAKIQELSKPQENPELAEAIKNRDTQIDKLKSQIAGLQFQESEEFKKKFQKPFNKAAAQARTMISEMDVLEEDADTGMQSSRKADWHEDFVKLYHLPYGPRLALAQKKFGNAAPMVLGKMDTLHQLNSDMDEARAEEESGWQEKAKERAAQEAVAKKEMAQQWETVNSEISEKHPEWFEHDAKDKEAAELLKDATDLADLYFNNRFGSLKVSDQVILEAQMRQRFRALPLVMRRLHTMQAQLQKANEQLEEYKASDPANPTRRDRGGSTKPASDNPEEEFRPILEQAFTR